MKKEQKKWGVVVARFQTHKLHPGHVKLLNFVAERHENVLVFLGVPASLEGEKDPLNFKFRKQMLLEFEFKKRPKNLLILPIKDQGEPYLWSEILDKMIKKHAGEMAVLYGSRDSFLKQYKGSYPFVFVPEDKESPSATFLRKKILKKGVEMFPNSKEAFFAGIIFQQMQRPPIVYQAVDIAVLKGEKVLLARKKRDKEKWRFVGGFVDAKDKSLEKAALRELQEETGVRAKNLRYIRSLLVDDWRYKGKKDKIMSAFFVGEYERGKPVPQDDIEECAFLPVALLPEILIPEHQDFGKALLEFLKI